MLSRDQLKWTPKDTEIVEKFKKDVKTGKIQTMNFLDIVKESKSD